MPHANQTRTAALASTLAVCAALSASALAADPEPVRRLYPQPLVVHASRTFAEPVRAVWTEVLQKVPEPYDQPAGKVQLLLPTYGATPLSFTTEADALLLPAESLRFVDDLLTAIGRRAESGCNATAVFDYVSMSAGGKTVKSPMAALGLTSRTDTAAATLFGSWLRFTLAHEVGHVVLGHAGAAASAKDALQREREADAFALDTVAQLRVIPTGVAPYLRAVLLFEAANAAGGAPRQVALGHSLAPDRVRALAKGLRVRAVEFGKGAAPVEELARELDAIAALLEDSGARDRELQRALGRSEASLRDCPALAGSGAP